MGKKAAVEGDVKATPGTTPFAPADSGAWVAGPVVDTPYPKLSSGGKKTLSQSMCTFTFTGVQSASGAAVSGTEVVTLAAKKTKLTAGGNLLLDGDNQQGVYGNKLQATASQQKLSTA
jgi:hypothetical protein